MIIHLTQTPLCAFSLLKRGIVGTYHRLSAKHLWRYLSEFSFRFDNRKNERLFALTVGRMLHWQQMPYMVLIAESLD